MGQYAQIGLDELIVPSASLGTRTEVLGAMDILMTEVFRPVSGTR